MNHQNCKAQIKEADINNDPLNNLIPSTILGLSYKTRSEAICTSRLLDFNNLPEPKNADDFYEQNAIHEISRIITNLIFFN
ncbi:hypothetical protein C1646_754868 [Rhizophagus diaphanus]|nr:hypothetical protein C1646_754868 [Rhizophagus diaphanus] [Rhizophagus sp. MUCL 43196]